LNIYGTPTLKCHLIEEGSFRLGERDDVRSPRLVYDRVILENITETLNDTIGILISKSFAAFLNHRHLKTTILLISALQILHFWKVDSEVFENLRIVQWKQDDL